MTQKFTHPQRHKDPHWQQVGCMFVSTSRDTHLLPVDLSAESEGGVWSSIGMPDSLKRPVIWDTFRGIWGRHHCTMNRIPISTFKIVHAAFCWFCCTNGIVLSLTWTRGLARSLQIEFYCLRDLMRSDEIVWHIFGGSRWKEGVTKLVDPKGPMKAGTDSPRSNSSWQFSLSRITVSKLGRWVKLQNFKRCRPDRVWSCGKHALPSTIGRLQKLRWNSEWLSQLIQRGRRSVWRLFSLKP